MHLASHFLQKFGKNLLVKIAGTDHKNVMLLGIRLDNLSSRVTTFSRRKQG